MPLTTQFTPLDHPDRLALFRLFNRLGQGRIPACSVGSQPAGAVHPQSLKRLAGLIGAAFLLFGVVGSGIMGETLSGGNVAGARSF